MKTDYTGADGSEIPVSTSNPLPISVISGGGGAATIADGADVAEGATADAAVVTDANGTVSGKLRGLVKILADVWDSANHWLKVALQAGENHIGAVGGNTAVVETIFKTSGGDVAIPATPTVYAVGGVIGGAFSPALARLVNGTGIILAATLIERMTAAAYVAQAVTATNATPCVFTLVAHGLLNGNRVRLGGTVPTGFTAGTTYYVQSVTANTFTLTATLGGAAIASTSTGTSVTLTEVSGQLNCQLILSRVAFAAPTTDATLFDPTYADQGAMKQIISFSSWQVPGSITATAGGRCAFANGNISTNNGTLPFKCVGGVNTLFGVLPFNGTALQVLSPHAELVLRLSVSQD